MRTITKLVDPQPHGAISECVSGECAVVGFDIHQNVIDANITFHGKYVGDTVKFGDIYYIIREARVVAIKDEWWWILDVEEDAYAIAKIKVASALSWLATDIKRDFVQYSNDYGKERSELESIGIVLFHQLVSDKGDRNKILAHIAFITALLAEWESGN